MMFKNKLDIKFYDFDVQGNCYADIVLPISETDITGFKVKQGIGGGIMVHMPSSMGTTWTFEEIEWLEVRKQIVEEYWKLNHKHSILVTLRDFDENHNCIADITLCESGVQISELKVMPGHGGGVMVYMPSWMHSRWSYSEVQWSEVRETVTREYLNTVDNMGFKNFEQSQDSHDKNGICKFYSFVEKTEAIVDVVIPPSNEHIQDILLVQKNDDVETVQVCMPKEMNNHWNNACIEWERLVEIITEEYRRQVLDEENDTDPETVRVNFINIRKMTTCLMDLKLPHKINIIRGFRIKEIKGNEKIIVSMPNWMGRWNDKKINWYDLCSIISREYSKYEEKKEAAIHKSSLLQKTVLLSKSDVLENDSNMEEQKSIPQIKEKNEFGRIKNAENSSFVFYPRTVLRAVDISENKGTAPPKGLFDLVVALNKGSLGGIGPFEINILEWIEKLRYVTSTMLLDLIKAGYVSFGWRRDVTQAKLSKIISRMSDYNLITLTRFMTVNDDGNLYNENRSVMRIITMGRNGSTLLHELGKNSSRFNAFDIFQDGNTVKRYLTANQWLIYWLKTYKEEIGENYETSCIIHQKGADYIGARIYATVTLNGCTMIAEPVRRVESFEIEKNKKWLCEKIERMIFMFDNMDQLYHGKDEISFPQRPIIVLVCEDDDHIYKVWENIKFVLPEDHCQMIWFSHDLRIFNYNKRGERFMYFEDGRLQPVNIKQIFGKDNEIEN